MEIFCISLLLVLLLLVFLFVCFLNLRMFISYHKENKKWWDAYLEKRAIVLNLNLKLLPKGRYEISTKWLGNMRWAHSRLSRREADLYLTGLEERKILDKYLPFLRDEL